MQVVESKVIINKIFRSVLIVVAGVYLSSCQSGAPGKTITLSNGAKTTETVAREISEPKFNAFLYLKNFSKVEYSRQANYSVEKEKYYQGGGYTLNIQHTLRSWFGNNVEQGYQDKARFVQFLKTVRKPELESSIQFVRLSNGYGYYANNDRCIVARFAKRIKSHTIFDNDSGQPDTIVMLVTCQGLTVSAEEFMDLLDFAGDKDRASDYRVKG
ncbi:MAG: hypothetical protein HOC33_17710 [Alphaproteobacteria bacterium]|nr:hypothetical protein [Alphaproteobacteria bacterium]MBT4084500.1 hypothetical protein [Alphaproteobacteria bacterium]MBT4545693.1 hypothetical protein [Alphaproteobacteria bacterium]